MTNPGIGNVSFCVSAALPLLPRPPGTASEETRTVFTLCLVCSTPFEANEELEHAPHAYRLAFDPSRGRLWAICQNCRRWSLMPIEGRWEGLEELE